MKKNEALKIIYQNTRGLRTKTKQFYLNTLSKEYDLICITESWLHDGIKDSELFCDSYQVFRLDRDLEITKKDTGGGVIIGLKNEYTGIEITELNNMSKHFECLWVKITKPINIDLCVIYFPTPQKKIQLMNFAELLEKRNSSDNSKLLIIGDFNITGIKDSNTNLLNCNSLALELYYILNNHNLISLNNIKNNYGKTLDLILCEESIAQDIQINKATSLTEKPDPNHATLSICIETTKKITKKNMEKSFKYNFNKIDWVVLYNEWNNTDWEPLFFSDDVNDGFQYFYNTLYNILDKHVPKTNINNKYYLHWWSQKTISLYKKKKRKHKQFPTTIIHLQKLEKIKKDFLDSLEHDYKFFIIKTSNNLKLEPKSFWNFIKSKRKKLIPKSFIINNKPVSNNQTIADHFADFFMTVYNIADHTKNKINTSTKNPTLDIIDINIITEEDIIKAIKKLAVNKGPGPDKLPPKIIKMASKLITPALYHLFNLSIKHAIFPILLKNSEVVPIPKKGNPQLINNYRPINKTNTFSKIFEIIIYEKIQVTVMKNINPNQHGFLRKKSTDTNLLIMQAKIIDTFNENKQLDVINNKQYYSQ